MWILKSWIFVNWSTSQSEVVFILSLFLKKTDESNIFQVGYAGFEVIGEGGWIVFIDVVVANKLLQRHFYKHFD